MPNFNYKTFKYLSVWNPKQRPVFFLFLRVLFISDQFLILISSIFNVFFLIYGKSFYSSLFIAIIITSVIFWDLVYSEFIRNLPMNCRRYCWRKATPPPYPSLLLRALNIVTVACYPPSIFFTLYVPDSQWFEYSEMYL